MADNKREKIREQVKISPAVEWQEARTGIEERRRLLDSESFNSHKTVTFLNQVRKVLEISGVFDNQRVLNLVGERNEENRQTTDNHDSNTPNP